MTKTEDYLPKDLPQASIYVVGAVSAFHDLKHVKLEDIMILSESDDQLKYTYLLATPDEQKKAHVDQPTLKLKQCIGYVLIDTPKVYYQFVHDFLNDKKAINNKHLPEKLTKTFKAYLTRKEAQAEADRLQKLQDTYYNALLNRDKPYARKQQLIVIDLIDGLTDFIGRKILPNMMNDPEFKKRFKQTEKQMHKMHRY